MLFCFFTSATVYSQTDSLVIKSSIDSTNGLRIIPGLGVKGLIEIGKTKKENKKTIGKGIKGKEDTWGGCVRVKGHRWAHFIDYPKYGFKAYIDRSKHKKQIINYIDFDSSFVGELENGIKIGRTTRKEIYAIYGQKEYHNPAITYSSLGIGFLFDNDYVIGTPDDILVEISVFAVKEQDDK